MRSDATHGATAPPCGANPGLRPATTVPLAPEPAPVQPELHGDSHVAPRWPGNTRRSVVATPLAPERPLVQREPRGNPTVAAPRQTPRHHDREE